VTDTSASTAPAIVATILPDPPALFEARARRLAALAPGSAIEPYLALLARVARGQARAVREVAIPAPPARGGAVPLWPSLALVGPAWRRMLATVVAAARGPDLPGEADAALRRLEAAAPAALDRMAEAILAGGLAPAVRAESLAEAPFVGAALQAGFALLAAGLYAAALAPADCGCPACGSPPVAGVIHGVDRLRYLACALCGTSWYLPRVHCGACGGNAGIVHLALPGEDGLKAEACGACGAYVKLVDEERRPGAEPLADDAATLTLDLLVAQEGYGRAGPNLLLRAAPAEAA